MLYDRWRSIALKHGNEIALIDSASGQEWTFENLAKVADQYRRGASVPGIPHGVSPSFIFEVLRAWRNGTVVCPIEEGQAVPPLAGLPPECVHVKMTSASTGARRLIAFTEEQLAADVDQIVQTMGLRHDWPNVAVISLAHSYGFSNLVLPLLLHGIPLVLSHSPLPESVRRAASLVRAVTLPAVPALWRAWVDSRVVPGNVRLAISAGAPLPLSLEDEAYRQCGLKIHNFYGASECGGIAYDRSTVPREDAACVGAALSGVGLSINEEGCLRVCSRAAGLTYWPEPSPALEAGCYQSSDLALIESSLVFLRGRQSDQINVAGRKVSPEQIERVLASHPNVQECLVFGVPSADLDRTEMIVACIVVQADTTAEALKQHLLRHLPAWQLPRDWWFVPALQTNVRGKLARGEWRQKYLSRHESA